MCKFNRYLHSRLSLKYLFFYYRILFLIVVYILTVFSCDLLSHPLSIMSFFSCFSLFTVNTADSVLKKKMTTFTVTTLVGNKGR